jgi:FKBP-type peptidyl-prolyl cis-trans isomerase
MNLKKSIALFAGLGVVVTVTYFGFGAANQENAAVAQDSKWKTTAKVDLGSEKAKLGYTFGAQMASELVRAGLVDEVELEAIFAAFRDITSGTEPQLSIEEMQQVQAALQQRQQAEFEVIAVENKTKGEAFLVQNATADGIKTTESGLQYQVVREGKGKQPTAENTVKVHYLGSLIDGTPFDSSYKRGAPTDFPVSAVIPGFAEGLQLMKEGAKYRFVIPADKAYGSNGPAGIGPNQTLIFEVELIEVL